MTPEIRRAALRAAAKAALLTTVGCWGSAPAPAATPVGNDKPTEVKSEPAASCASDLDKLAKGKQSELSDGDPLKGQMGVYGNVFLDPAQRNSARTQQCCNEELGAGGASAPHRWECCSALGTTADGAACTPWGPPNPPEYVA